MSATPPSGGAKRVELARGASRGELAMGQATYQRWWPLHLRVVRGEKLSAEEEPIYEAGLRQLDQGEFSPASGAAVQESRTAVAALEAEHAALVARRRQLDEE